MNQVIHKSRPLRGEFRVPGDKSITHRALLIGALADGISEIDRFLDAGDTGSTIECLRNLGIQIDTEDERAVVRGAGLYGLRRFQAMLDAGNSGTTIRLLSGILAGQPFESAISGDKSLVQRPMMRIIEPLSQMGALIESTSEFTAPLKIVGVKPLRAIDYKLLVPSAQVKSAILLAGLFADGITVVRESTISRDHTERLLGLNVGEVERKRMISIAGGMHVAPLKMDVPGDISSAAYLIVAGLVVPGSEIVVRDVGINESRTGFLDILRELGADIRVADERRDAAEPFGDLYVKASSLRGSVDLSDSSVPPVIDEIPILAVAAAVSGCSFRVRGASELRKKESDRISAIVGNLRALDVDVEEYPDGFAFEAKNRLISTHIETRGDHRVAMAFAVAGLVLEGETTIRDAESVGISYPGFWETLQKFQP